MNRAPQGIRQDKVSSRPRSRWPIFSAALFLLWCAFWYCRGEGESQAIVWLTLGFALSALSRARTLPATTRWVVWSGIVLTILFLSANLARIVPPDSAWEESRTVDRAITVAFAWGVTALFFQPSVSWVTLMLVGGLPMAMVVLGRAPDVSGALDGHRVLFVWGLVVLMALLDQSQRLTMPRSADRRNAGLSEMAWRGTLIAAAVLLAIGARKPIEQGVRWAQQRLSGWMYYAGHTRHRHASDLVLYHPTARAFARRMRLVLLVESPHPPGYLRERVYTNYRSGRWVANRTEQLLERDGVMAASDGVIRYTLRDGGDPATALRSEFTVLMPDLLDAFALPGSALALLCDGAPPMRERSGSVTPQERLPERYAVLTSSDAPPLVAWPEPAGLADPAYLELPPLLAASVSNWTAQCTGFLEAESVAQAAHTVGRYFERSFQYRLGVRLRSRPDPLLAFMEQRAGSCTHFASAAALMFRARGMPARVIGGFVCVEWHPWLKRWVVREREGHAWVEVWDTAAARWLLVDPTPQAGHPSAWRRPGRWRWTLDLWRAWWHRSLVYLRGASLLELVADTGETITRFIWQAIVSLPGAVVLAGWVVVWWLRRRAARRALPPRTALRLELMRAMRRIERSSTPAHLRRRQSESWDGWFARIASALPAEKRCRLQAALTAYQTLRYREAFDPAAARDWLARRRR